MSRTVMYIGPKAMKFDNINGVGERKWHGAGTVVTAISPMQADKLCAHKTEFLDVTGKTEEEVAQLAAKARADRADYKRGQHRSTGQGGAILLEYATDEQLMAEVGKRKLARQAQSATVTQPPKPAAPAAQTSSKPAGKNTGKGGNKAPSLAGAKETLPPADKSETPKAQQEITEHVEEVIGKLLEKNDADDFKDGIPTRAAVERELGFQITETEYEIALGGKAPAEQPDKTGFQDGPAAQQ